MPLAAQHNINGRRHVLALVSDAPVPNFNIHYAEGLWLTEFTNPGQFSDLDGKPWEAPGADLLSITWLNEYGSRRTLFNGNFYFYLREAGANGTEGRFTPGDAGALARRLLRGESLVVFEGEWVPDAEFDRVLEAARRDPRFPEAVANRAETIAALEAAALLTGPDALGKIEQAIFNARLLGHPRSLIDSIVLPALVREASAAL